MTFFDWLVTPSGIEFTHAVILLVTAIAGYVAYRSHVTTTRVERKLDRHIQDITELQETPPGKP